MSTSKKLRKTFHRRVWLAPNNPDQLSYIAYTIAPDGSLGEVTIADCARIVNLDFYYGSSNKASIKQALTKMDRLIKALQECRDKIEDDLNKAR